MAEMEFAQVTWMRAAKVWWSLLWRGLLFGILSGAGVGFVLRCIMGLAKAEPGTIKAVCTLAGYIVFVPVGITVTKIILKKRYSDFKIALVTRTNQD